MKKRTTKKTVSKRVAKKSSTTRRKTVSRRQPTPTSFSFHRIIIYTSCVALFVFAFAWFNKPQVNQAVAGVSITRGLFAEAQVALPASIPHAASYNIYYRESDGEYTNAVRNIPVNVTTYTISYLQKGKSYLYKVSALDATGEEFWWSEEKEMTGLSSM